AEKNRALLTKFLKGMVLGMRWYLENKEAAIEFLVTDLKLKPEHARRGWEFYKGKGLWNPQIELNIKGMNTTLQIYNEVSALWHAEYTRIQGIRPRSSRLARAHRRRKPRQLSTRHPTHLRRHRRRSSETTPPRAHGGIRPLAQ
ncbi:MAG: hypothetical protein ABIP88_00325, partial [Candidatus Binatia bacterium]